MRHPRLLIPFFLCPLLLSCGGTPLTVEEAKEQIAFMRQEAQDHPPLEASIRILHQGESDHGQYKDVEEFSFSSAETFLHSRTLLSEGDESSAVSEEWVYGEQDVFIHAQAKGEEKTYKRYPFQGNKEEAFFSLPGVKEGQEKFAAMLNEGYDAFGEFFDFMPGGGFVEDGGSLDEEIANTVKITSSKEKALKIEGGIHAKSSALTYTLVEGYAEIEENLPKRFSLHAEFMANVTIEGSYAYRAETFSKPNLEEFALAEGI